MLSQFAKWLRRLPAEFDCQLNLLSAEMAVDQPVGTAKQGVERELELTCRFRGSAISSWNR